MKATLKELASVHPDNGEERANQLKVIIASHLPEWQEEFLQDLSHISEAAVFSGNMQVDQVEHLKDNLYRCDYAYDWQIAWTCSGTQEAGRVNEKVRFVVNEPDEIEFKFLKLDL